MPSPLVQATVDALVKRIESQDLTPDRPLPSERQLALDHGVSRVVIRAAVLELAAQGRIICKPRCRPVVAGLRSTTSIRGKTKNVALWLWPNSNHFSASLILRGIQRVLATPSYRVIISHPFDPSWEDAMKAETRFLMELGEDPDTVGAIVWYLGHERNLPALRTVREAGIQLVFVDRRPPMGFEADYVGTDNQHSALEAVRHLIGLGHRSIACLLNMDPASSVLERLSGYKQALHRSDIPIREELIVGVQLQTSEDDLDDAATATIERLMANPNPPTAIFAINDDIALHAMIALKRLGLCVPEDVSIMGFDDLLRSIPGVERVSTAHQRFDRVGECAAELLVERLEGTAPRSFRHVMLEAPLRLYGSTASPNSKTK